MFPFLNAEVENKQTSKNKKQNPKPQTPFIRHRAPLQLFEVNFSKITIVVDQTHIHADFFL